MAAEVARRLGNRLDSCGKRLTRVSRLAWEEQDEDDFG